MLTLTKSKKSIPVALIRNKKDKKKNKIVYIDDVDYTQQKINDDDDDFDIFEYMNEDKLRPNKKEMSFSDLKDLERALKIGKEPVKKELKKIFRDLKSELEEIMKKEIILNYDEELEILPNPKSERLYLCGPSGSGKSHNVSQYIKNFKKIWKNKKIYLFSEQENDDILDQFKPIRIKLDEELIDDPISTKEISDSLTIFDDIDDISNKKLKNSVYDLKDSLLKRGRHENIYTITTNHQCTDYKNTRDTINESHIIFVYPRSGSAASIKYLLKTYLGFTKEQIEKILKLPSRWVAIHKSYPVYVMYQNGIYLI